MQTVRIAILSLNQNVANIQSTMLRAAGFRQITMLDSEDVYKAAVKHFGFDVILINDLGGLNLRAVATHLRDEVVVKSPFTAAIVFSSKVTRTSVRRVIQMGFDELLSIPFSAEALFAKINYFAKVDRKFIRVGGYFGPERRRFFEGPPLGVGERRKTEKQSGDTIMQLSPETRAALARQAADAAQAQADPMQDMHEVAANCDEATAPDDAA